MLISIENAQLAFGHHPLLNKASLRIFAGERVGLVGRNGTGKSSLMKAISGEINFDAGSVWRAADLKLAYVPQEPLLPLDATVFDVVAAGLGDVVGILSEYHHLTHEFASGAHDEALSARLAQLQHDIEDADGWRVDSRVETTLTRLKLDGDALVQTLSGGTKKRVALARAIVSEPDLLLLDEPTNHLDVDSIEWLEQLLIDSAMSVLLITHDRRFLDRVVTRIVELDRGILRDYPGNFSAYESRKQEELEIEAKHGEKFDKLLAQEEVWIRKGIEARRTRNEGRVRRLEQLRRERSARRDRIGSVNLSVNTGERSGQLVAELKDVAKRFGERIIVKDFTTRILRGDKIGLIGPNGIGKTTLLRMILGEIPPDSGTVRLGSNLSIAYFDQFRAKLDDEATVVDVIAPGSDFVEIGGARKHVMSYLDDFLFPPERARAKVKSLSGGERNRLLLARLFTQPANVLVLDEPTNDLDIDTLELLEVLLQDYQGTVFLVSHDRAFLNNVVTQVIAFEGAGVLREYPGGYDDWKRMRLEPSGVTVPAKATEKAQRQRQKDKPRLSFNEVRELEAQPQRIESLEKEQAEITRMLADGDLYRTDPARVARLNARFTEIDTELEQALARWEELERKKALAG